MYKLFKQIYHDIQVVKNLDANTILKDITRPKNPQETPMFVEKYTLVDPAFLFVPYNVLTHKQQNEQLLYMYCETGEGLKKCINTLVPIPNIPEVVSYLTTLEKYPYCNKNEVNRTVTKIHISRHQCLYIIPKLTLSNTKKRDGVIFVPYCYHNPKDKSWVLKLTPDKRKQIVEQMKFYTR